MAGDQAGGDRIRRRFFSASSIQPVWPRSPLYRMTQLDAHSGLLPAGTQAAGALAVPDDTEAKPVTLTAS